MSMQGDPANDSHQYYSVEKAAVVLGVSERVVSDLCRRGAISAYKADVSGKWRISHSEILRYQAEGPLPPDSVAVE